jgi:hypothetical protein
MVDGVRSLALAGIVIPTEKSREQVSNRFKGLSVLELIAVCQVFYERCNKHTMTDAHHSCHPTAKAADKAAVVSDSSFCRQFAISLPRMTHEQV